MIGMEHSSGEPPVNGHDLTLIHDRDRERYEVVDGAEVQAVLYYADEPGAGGTVRDLRSTVVAPQHNGKGLGSAVVRRALDDARADGLVVRPTCWFVEGWIGRHPEYADLLEPAAPGAEESR